MYDVIDQDGDGYITHHEIKQILQSTGIKISSHEAADFISTHDVNGDGFIDFNEFKNLLRQTLKRRSGDLIELFRFLDLDKDNKINYEEFKRGMRILGENVTDREVAHFMQKYFQSQDNSINFNQFCVMFHKFV